MLTPLERDQGVDIHKDTPTELLHTILLGIVKYFWGQTMFVLDKKKTLEQFRARLNSVDPSGLDIPKLPADYMCKHRFSLIGKHFKSIVQVMPFIAEGRWGSMATICGVAGKVQVKKTQVQVT